MSWTEEVIWRLIGQDGMPEEGIEVLAMYIDKRWNNPAVEKAIYFEGVLDWIEGDHDLYLPQHIPVAWTNIPEGRTIDPTLRPTIDPRCFGSDQKYQEFLLRYGERMKEVEIENNLHS